MKSTKKLTKEYLKAVVPLCNPKAELCRAVYQRNRCEVDAIGKVLRDQHGRAVKMTVDVKAYVNHKRRLRTLLRQAQNQQELQVLTKQYIDRYPNPQNFNLQTANV